LETVAPGELATMRIEAGEPPEAPAANHIAPDAQVGRFGLIREIAKGGMGQVFLARDTKLGRKVAIKFLLDSTPSFVQRFLIEAKATALCTHENIVTIFEVGEYQGLPFMVLEYLQGKTLTELLVDRPTPRSVTKMFAGLRSRCTMPCSCARSSARTTGTMSSANWRGVGLVWSTS